MVVVMTVGHYSSTIYRTCACFVPGICRTAYAIVAMFHATKVQPIQSYFFSSFLSA